MLAKIRSRLTYANVMATIAVFIALGGSSYAAVKINGKNIKNRTVAGTKLKNDTLTGTQINEGTLGTVPLAANADRAGSAGSADQVDGLDSQDLKVRCPDGTRPFAGDCFETNARSEAQWRDAASDCAEDGRRLPTPDELFPLLAGTPGDQPDEMTSVIHHDFMTASSVSQRYTLIFEFTPGGGTTGTLVDSREANLPAGYRCVATPSN